MAAASAAGTRKLRLFISLNPSLAMVEELTHLQSRLRFFLKNHGLGGLRPAWVKPSQFHMTLHFLGDVPELLLPWLREILDTAAAETGPLELTTAGMGCFPVFRNPKVIWLGLAPHAGLQNFQQDLAGRLNEKIALDRSHGFFPHVTLSRLQPQDPAVLNNFSLSNALKNEFPLTRAMHWSAKAVTLMESRQYSHGAEYRELHRGDFK